MFSSLYIFKIYTIYSMLSSQMKNAENYFWLIIQYITQPGLRTKFKNQVERRWRIKNFTNWFLGFHSLFTKFFNICWKSLQYNTNHFCGIYFVSKICLVRSVMHYYFKSSTMSAFLAALISNERHTFKFY